MSKKDKKFEVLTTEEIKNLFLENRTLAVQESEKKDSEWMSKFYHKQAIMTCCHNKFYEELIKTENKGKSILISTQPKQGKKMAYTLLIMHKFADKDERDLIIA